MPRASVDVRALADQAACRELIRHGSKSFFAASLLLPAAVRLPACALYAFCRLSDDAVDGPQARADAVDRLRDRLDRVYAGRPRDIAADRAFAGVVEHFAMPRALPDALLEGLAWDAAGRRYATLSDLVSYAARVAASVGAMMTVIMGVRDADVLARACDLGIAMQLTNVARDIGEDARAGRLYLPLDWLDAAGIDSADFVSRPVFTHRLGTLVERLLDEAERLYDRALPGIAGLPPGCRPAIHAARLIYREIGREVRRRGGDSVTGRAVVPGRRRLALAAAACGAACRPARPSRVPALPETLFLVNAAALPRRRTSAASPLGAVDARVGWIIELFGAMEQRAEEGRGGGT